MELRLEPLKCTGCRACEFACSYHHDREWSAIGSSIILYREEKKNYFGPVFKREKDVLLGRPEGVEVLKPGAPSSGGGKPILMRPVCDLCEGEEKALCEAVCPMGVITIQ